MGWWHVLPFSGAYGEIAPLAGRWIGLYRLPGFLVLLMLIGVAGMPGDPLWCVRPAARSWSVRGGSGCPKCQSERWGGIMVTRRLITGLPALEIS